MIHPDTVAFDIETFPNCFTLNAQSLFGDGLDLLFEISEFRDDRESMQAWFEWWHTHQTPMVGFNSLGFDYPVIHRFWLDPWISYTEMYDHAMEIIGSFSRFGHQVWESERFCPQIDLMKIHHMDNRAKATSLKALQFAMRSESVMEAPIEFGKPVTREQIDQYLIPYNRHDVKATKQFARYSMEAIKFRSGLQQTLRGDVLNFNDTKIGAKLLEQRLGAEVCYDESRKPRQTPRTRIALADIIFPYIKFNNPEFNRVLDWMRQQTLTADELSDNETIRTKGVFNGVKATVGGLDFWFGTGGIHSSVSAGVFASDDEWVILDIDVEGLYPRIAIVNRLFPEHLGMRFVEEYEKLPIERKKHVKGTVENAAFKLASNGTYGNSNNQFSVFYDPRFTMAITINGQLMLCMLAEWLLNVPSLQIIQINTDGVTYRVRREHVADAKAIEKQWQAYTLLILEEVEYSKMWIRDVNNYIAKPADPKKDLKQKGAYWYPRKFPEDISNGSPPAWHKDYSSQVVIRAAVEHMVNGVDLERFIYGHADPFDFMCRAKVDRASQLWIGDQEVQRICRYYVAQNGGEMKKVSPPAKGARVGDFKRKNGISDWDYHTVLQEVGQGVWDERIHTKNRSTYIIREMGIEAGFSVAECNIASHFDFANVNYDWYIEKARKLVIA